MFALGNQRQGAAQSNFVCLYLDNNKGAKFESPFGVLSTSPPHPVCNLSWTEKNAFGQESAPQQLPVALSVVDDGAALNFKVEDDKVFLKSNLKLTIQDPQGAFHTFVVNVAHAATVVSAPVRATDNNDPYVVADFDWLIMGKLTIRFNCRNQEEFDKAIPKLVTRIDIRSIDDPSKFLTIDKKVDCTLETTNNSLTIVSKPFKNMGGKFDVLQDYVATFYLEDNSYLYRNMYMMTSANQFMAVNLYEENHLVVKLPRRVVDSHDCSKISGVSFKTVLNAQLVTSTFRAIFDKPTFRLYVENGHTELQQLYANMLSGDTVYIRIRFELGEGGFCEFLEHPVVSKR